MTASMDNTAKIWDSKTMQEIVSLIGHKGEIVTATYSPNGQQIVTASYDGTAKVWDAETGLELVTLTGHDGRVTSATYSPNEQRIVTSGTDAIIRIYTTDIHELLQMAEGRVTRQLTAKEKEKYGVLD